LPRPPVSGAGERPTVTFDVSASIDDGGKLSFVVIIAVCASVIVYCNDGWCVETKEAAPKVPRVKAELKRLPPSMGSPGPVNGASLAAAAGATGFAAAALSGSTDPLLRPTSSDGVGA
jgi:hypothetical protein